MCIQRTFMITCHKMGERRSMKWLSNYLKSLLVPTLITLLFLIPILQTTDDFPQRIKGSSFRLMIQLILHLVRRQQWVHLANILAIKALQCTMTFPGLI